MGEYTLRVFRKLLCVALIFSLLWPDVAKCMDDEEEKISQPKHSSLPIYLFSETRGDQKRDFLPPNEQQHSLTIKENTLPSEDPNKDANNPTLSEKDNVTEEITNNNENSSSDSSAVTTKEIQPPVLEDKEEISKENSSDNKVSPGEQKDPSPELNDKEDIEGGENVNPKETPKTIVVSEENKQPVTHQVSNNPEDVSSQEKKNDNIPGNDPIQIIEENEEKGDNPQKPLIIEEEKESFSEKTKAFLSGSVASVKRD